MVRWLRKSRSTRIVLALCVLAAITLGFAHWPLALRRLAAATDLAAYTLPDGTPPLLCLAEPDVGEGPPPGTRRACVACALASAAGLPAAAEALPAPHTDAGARIAVAADAGAASSGPENVRSRAPPTPPTAKV